MMYFLIKYIRVHAHVEFPNSILIVQKIAYFIPVPLNSAINPVVYFIRKQDMRHFLKEVWFKMWKKISHVSGFSSVTARVHELQMSRAQSPEIGQEEDAML